MGISWVRFLVYAFLSDVFQNNFLSREFVLYVKWAIFSSSKAMLFYPFFLTFAALPIYKMGFHQNFLSKFFIKISEVWHKIKDKIVVASVPNIIFDSIVWSPQVELYKNRNLCFCIGSSTLHEIKQLCTLFIINKHWWDSKTCTTTVIRHDDLSDILFFCYLLWWPDQPLPPQYSWFSLQRCKYLYLQGRMVLNKTYHLIITSLDLLHFPIRFPISSSNPNPYFCRRNYLGILHRRHH